MFLKLNYSTIILFVGLKQKNGPHHSNFSTCILIHDLRLLISLHTLVSYVINLSEGIAFR